MFAAPKYPEINHHTIKLIVGLIVLTLATLTNFFSDTAIASISASYYEGDWARNIFVGFLYAVSAFLLAYNGRSKPQMLWSKVAALAALGVAMFPCECGSGNSVVPYVHGASAAVMFGVLAYFCYCFYERVRSKPHKQAKVRAGIYAVSGVVIVLAIAVLFVDFATGGSLTAHLPRLVFYGEAASLTAFGVSWLTASRCLPLITHPGERLSLLQPAPAGSAD